MKVETEFPVYELSFLLLLAAPREHPDFRLSENTIETRFLFLLFSFFLSSFFRERGFSIREISELHAALQ